MMWLRFPEEASVCPACRSQRLTMLDVIPVTRGAKGRRVAFLAGCVDCGLVFTNPMPTEEQQAKYYADEGPYRAHKVEAAEAKRKERKAGPRAATKAPRARDLLLEALTPYVPINAPPPGAKVLDFGCGDGKMLNRLQDAGWETYGIEPWHERRIHAPSPADGSAAGRPVRFRHPAPRARARQGSPRNPAATGRGRRAKAARFSSACPGWTRCRSTEISSTASTGAST